MRTLSVASILALLVAMPSLAAEPARGPMLGRIAAADQVAARDISIGPDGVGLPPGRGSVAQGREIFVQACQACHNEAGKGQPADRLTGGIGTLGTAAPVKTVASYWPYATTLFDYIRRAMPIQSPQSLGDDQVYAVVAYLLSLDGIVPEAAVLDAKAVVAVRMPNRDGFVAWPATP